MRTTTTPPLECDAPPSTMDVRDALSRLGDDRELLKAIIEIYLEDSPALLEKVRRAVMGNDPPALHRAAHSLKGLAVTLSAGDVATAASRLEHMGSSRSLADAALAVTELESRLKELNAAAQPYLKNGRRGG
jgi:HPt (histidine-containing phosphotransfer) domain-containing protein